MKTYSLTILVIVLITIFTSGVNAQILLIEPDSAEQGQTLNIEVTAENIDFTQGTNVVKIQQGNFVHYMNSAYTVSPTSLTANFSFNTSQPVGYYDFSVLNTFSNTTFTKSDGFYLQPDLTPAAIDSISPTSAYQGEEVTITIYSKNTNFTQSLETSSVKLYNSSTQIYAESIYAIDSVTLQATFNFTYAHACGNYSIFVYNNIDGTFTLPNSFTIKVGENPPTILTILPDSAKQGQTLNIEITAENIDFTQGTNVVKIQQGDFTHYMNSAYTSSPTTLTANFSFNTSQPVGYYDFIIQNTFLNTSLLKPNGFLVTSNQTTSEIDSISPVSARQGDDVTVTIYCTKTHFDVNDESISVWLSNSVNQIYASTISIIDSVTLQAWYSFSYAHTSGIYSIFVYGNENGTFSLPNAFTLQAGSNQASIIAIAPDNALQGETLDILVTAENINFSQGTNIAKIQQGNYTHYMNSSVLVDSVTISANFSFTESQPSGYYDFVVHNTYLNKTITKANGFYVGDPSVYVEVGSSENVVIYPNPSANQVYLNAEFATIELFDSFGKKVLIEKNKKVIDVSNIPKGLYFLVLKNQNETVIKKLVVK